jgi:hypothetical protein
MLICVCLNGNWSDRRVLCDEHERTPVQELQLAYLNARFMQGVCSLRTVLLIVVFYEAV